MQAILWDGKKQVKGRITLSTSSLHFVFSDFSDTSLMLKIEFSKIEKLTIQRIYDFSVNTISIYCMDGGVNNFVVKNPISLKKQIIALMELSVSKK